MYDYITLELPSVLRSFPQLDVDRVCAYARCCVPLFHVLCYRRLAEECHLIYLCPQFLQRMLFPVDSQVWKHCLDANRAPLVMCS